MKYFGHEKSGTMVRTHICTHTHTHTHTSVVPIIGSHSETADYCDNQYR